METSKDGNEKVTSSDAMCIQLPICVLVNSETFGEAELCAAVLQENQWATVLGEATTGKTRTQETITLSDGSALRLSTGTYLTGNRTDISAKGGVVPDVNALSTLILLGTVLVVVITQSGLIDKWRERRTAAKLSQERGR